MISQYLSTSKDLVNLMMSTSSLITVKPKERKTLPVRFTWNLHSSMLMTFEDIETFLMSLIGDCVHQTNGTFIISVQQSDWLYHSSKFIKVMSELNEIEGVSVSLMLTRDNIMADNLGWDRREEE